MNVLRFACALLAAVWLTLAVSPAVAQQKKPDEAKKKIAKMANGAPVIAILDVQQIIQKSVANAKARKKLEGYRANFDIELAKEREALTKRQEELKNKQLVLSKPALERERAALERNYLAWRQKRDQINTNLNQAYAVVVRRIRGVMATELAQLMKERSIDLTLARAAVLVFDQRLNITDDVIERLNKSLPEIKISFDPNTPPDKQPEKTQ